MSLYNSQIDSNDRGRGFYCALFTFRGRSVQALRECFVSSYAIILELRGSVTRGRKRERKRRALGRRCFVTDLVFCEMALARGTSFSALVADPETGYLLV
jgi:hypothetical protein